MSNDFVCRAPNCFQMFPWADERENHEWLAHCYIAPRFNAPDPVKKVMDEDYEEITQLRQLNGELLVALKSALPLMVGALAFVDCKKQIKQAEDAIAKAEGKTNETQ